MPEPMRIVLVDDHPLFREGVAITLAAGPGIEVVGQGANAGEAFRLAVDLLPDIIQQLGPKQHKLLESLVGQAAQGDSDAPDLVENKEPASTPQNLDSVE